MVAIDGSIKSIRIILVDDHELVRDAFRSVLETEDHLLVVGEAADGKAAIDLVQRVAADIVLLDLSMPGMSGLEVLRVLRRLYPELPVIVLTGCGEEARKAMMRAGAADYLSKGDDLVHVAQVIRMVASAPMSGDLWSEQDDGSWELPAQSPN